MRSMENNGDSCQPCGCSSNEASLRRMCVNNIDTISTTHIGDFFNRHQIEDWMYLAPHFEYRDNFTPCVLVYLANRFVG